MDHAAATSVSVLCFAEYQDVRFTELSRAVITLFSRHPRVPMDIVAHYDDLLVCDLPKMRICVAHCDSVTHLPPDAALSCVECLMVAVGDRPDMLGHGPEQSERYRICAALTERIERVHLCDDPLMIELGTAFTTQVYDQMLETIWPALAQGFDADGTIDLTIDHVA